MAEDLWLDKWKGALAEGSASPAILELGCGSGRDTRWLVQHGFADITATELSSEALADCARAVPGVRLVCHDLREPLPFADKRFDAVLASLCLHYFQWDVTLRIVREIRRCMAPGGLLLCRVNSTKDVHYGAAGHPQLSHHYYDVEGRPKRFFDQDEIAALFADGWECLSLQEMTIDRYEKPKTVWEAALRKR